MSGMELRLTERIEAVKSDLLKWTLGALFAFAGLIIAAVKLIP